MRGGRIATLASAAVASTILALLGAASPAHAGDPIMPLSEVRSGMKCTGYSVVRGWDVTSFDVEVVDIVGGDEGVRILVKVSGPAVDETGVGAGFSGSPVYCPGSDGQSKNAGAISETIGDYGGKTVLATPIEQILATAVNPPKAKPASQSRTGQSFGTGARWRWDPEMLRNARPMASPITIRGLRRDVFTGLQTAARRVGITVLQAPPLARAAQAQPAPQPFRPGSAVGVGLSSGALSVGAVGTVAYVDADRVWSFGHGFDATGERSLILQDAYVATVVNNPVQFGDGGGTYKFAGAVHDVGTATNDGFAAVVGRAGPLPKMIGVHVYAEDADTGRKTTTPVRVADESDLPNPGGTPGLSFVAPLAVMQGGTSVLDSAPVRIAGRMCAQITFKERRRPVRICNRYIGDGTGEQSAGGNLVALNASSDLAEVLALVDAYTPSNLHITDVGVRMSMTRGQRQAYMRKLVLPRRVRRGEVVRAKLVVRIVRGAQRTLRFNLRIPRNLRPGARTIELRGKGPDSADDGFGEIVIELGGGGEQVDPQGPRTLERLVREMRKVERYDGLTLGKRSGPRVYRHAELRIGGRERARVIVQR